MALTTYLEREYTRRRERNPRYSLRAFARDLGCDHANLSQWMRGTRVLTPSTVDALCIALGLEGLDRTRACELDACDLQMVAAAQASLARDCHALAAATGLGLDQVNLSLSKLIRLGVVRMSGSEWHIIEKELA